jgi:formyl-CoA transferase
MLLADMGADVIKVENPDGGDALRSWPPLTAGYSENFASLNRNKRSVTLNLKDPRDVKVFGRLAQGAQVLIENNRPGVMDRLGIGFEDLRESNPKLVYCSISAFGQTGPRSQEGGFDPPSLGRHTVGVLGAFEEATAG